ncbi:type I polyketide synthase [Nocardia alni]|uniref:type I polyketide synthase n=1 Tax=Nocardia alni TaxID=2815723 RepID=UPI001C236D7E
MSEAPLVVPPVGATELRVVAAEPDPGGARVVSVYSRPADDHAVAGERTWIRHSVATVVIDDETVTADQDLVTWPPADAAAVDMTDAYAGLAAAGYEYGPAFRGLTALWRRDDDIFAEVTLPESVRARAGQFGIHPALLDAALHTIALGGAAPAVEDGQIAVPFSWESVVLSAAGATSVRVRVRRAADGSLAVTLADPSGAPVAEVAAVRLQALERSALAAPMRRAGGAGYRVVDWVASPTPQVTDTGRWERVDGAETVTFADRTVAVVRLEERPSDRDLPTATREMVTTLMTRLQRLLGEDPTIVVVTRCAVAVGLGAVVDPAAAAAWGMLRSAQSEHPGRILAVDVEDWSTIAHDVAAALVTEGEPQLAVRGPVSYTPRLAHSADPVAGSERVHTGADWELTTRGAGTAADDNFVFTENPAAAAPLEPGQVRVSVRAVGLNFRDVLMTLNQFSDGRAGNAGIGSESAGVVLDVAPDVTEFAPGDRVFGFTSGVGSVVVADRRLLAQMPGGWTFAAAASVPAIFGTAYYSLVDLAAARAGETVLLHAATGGVGMATIQLARHLGLRLLVTASRGKWNILRDLGFDDEIIADSRAPGFESRFSAATGGAGADIVLNSLTGAFVDASLRLLPRGGRFIELGHTDERDPVEVADRHPGVEYHTFVLLDVRPQRLGEILTTLAGLFETGVLTPVPITAHDVRRAPELFRYFGQARHIGKNVLTVPPPPNPAGTVLITGGTGGLAAILSRHLVTEYGVRHLVLAGRRGPDAPGAAELRDALAELGARVEIVACDAADRDALDRVLAAIPAEHPLTGVVHAAGLLADGLFIEMTPDRLAAVLRPKVDAAWNLHEATAGLDLSFFVLYSSLAAVVGGPGQANYASANAFLDAVARQRDLIGLPATSMAWGLWEQGTGMTGDLEAADLARVRRMGFLPVGESDGMELFDAAFAGGAPVPVTVRLDRAGLDAADPADVLPIMRGLARPSRRRAGAATDGSSDLAARLAGRPPAEREEAVFSLVRVHAAAVLGHDDAEFVSVDKPFKDIGLNSLGVMEFRNRLVKATGLSLPTTVVFDHPTVADLAGHLLSLTAPAASQEVTARPARRSPLAVADDPIVIVGMSCRYPGGIESPDDLWRALAEGADMTGEFPADRGWDLERLFDPDPDTPGTLYARRAGFLSNPGDFDAPFFGIGPMEAMSMDPQQRLFLEASWEALENAGINPQVLRGSATSVFAGACKSGYSEGATGGELESFWLTGISPSVISGRVAYTLGLEGPAVTVDTACSSSLVALHQACRALRDGETSLALAGGVTVAASPYLQLGLARQRGLAPDGRCKPFAAGADGASFSEGVGVVVLERLSDARRLGHEVLAIVRGSAINQDGASNGLSAPNGLAQERVIAAALADAGVAPQDVDAVEAHGTGTTLGDPIEANALIAAYGRDRDGEPLGIGSLKSNIGHTVAAAGVGGLIKMVQALRHEMLPRTLHADELSPHVDWSLGTVRVLSTAQAWPATGRRVRRAGVSAFGISGTNAHVIIEEAPAIAASSRPVGNRATAAEAVTGHGVVPVVVSAKSPSALRDQAGRLREWLIAHPATDLRAVARTLLDSRALLDRSGVVTGRDHQEVIAGLAALESGSPAPNVVSVEPVHGKTAFLFTGQGPQRARMGCELYEAFPVFAAAMDEISAELDRQIGSRRGAPSLKEVMFAADSAGVLDRTEWTQPALFAFEVAMFRLWESLGVTADLLIGHSMGELAAAYAAGVWSLADACALVLARGRLMGALPAGGAMLVAAIAEPRAIELIGAFGDGVCVAALNGPASTVLSGDVEGIGAIERHLGEAGVQTTRVRVNLASHSALMDPILDEFRSVARTLTYHEPLLPIVSTVTGGWARDELTDPEYWVRELRSAVRFAPAVATAIDSGARRFIEVCPDEVLTVMIRGLLEERPEIERAALVVASSTRRSADEVTPFISALGQAYASGLPVHWDALLADRHAERISLPTYAFQHKRYWLQAAAPGASDSSGHPLLTASVPLAGTQGWLFTGRIAVRTHPWLADHAVAGSILFPGAGFAELALAAGDRLGIDVIEELILETPLVLPEQSGVDLQISVAAPDDSGRRGFTIYSRAAGAATSDAQIRWTTHATGIFTTAATPAAAWDEPVWPPADARPVDAGSLYERLSLQGFGYGPAFQGVRALWTRGEQAFAEVRLDETVGDASEFGIHPALLDACLHAGADVLPEDLAPGQVPLPFSFAGVRLRRRGASAGRTRARRQGSGRVGIELVDSAGGPVLSIDTVTFRSMDPARLRAAGDHTPLVLRWQPSDDVESSTAAVIFASLGTARIPGVDRRHATVGELTTAETMPDVIVWSVDTETVTARDAVHTAWDTLRSWLAAQRAADTRLVIATRRAVGRADEPVDAAAAAVMGLARSAHAEFPNRIVLIDHDGELSADLVRDLLASNQPQTMVRDSRVFVPRLIPGSPAPVSISGASEGLRGDASLPPAARRCAPVSTAPTGPFGDGAVLITGGTTGIGALIARHLARVHQVRHLVLASRRGAATDGAEALAAELAELGAAPRIVACDVADRESVAALLAEIADDHPLTAVIHSAGIIDDGTIESLTADRIDRVLAPKVAGAQNLHDLTMDLELSAFILFSSVAATIGSPGQGNYSAANSFMDALARNRRARGLAALSLVWGVWNQDIGITGGLDHTAIARMERTGIRILGEDAGLALFDAALGMDEPVVIGAEFDAATLAGQAAAGILPDLLTSLVPARTRRASTPTAGTGGDLLSALAAAPEDKRESLALEAAREHLAVVLGRSSAHDVDPDTALSELGLDSLGAIELRNRLATATGMRLPATLVFDHPTPAAVAGFLLSQVPAAPVDSVVDRHLATLRELLASPSSNTERDRLTEGLRELLAQARVESAVRTEVEQASIEDLFELIDQHHDAG